MAGLVSRVDAAGAAPARLARRGGSCGAGARLSRFLIVNADDFGRSRGVNGGVAEAHERGIVTSASLMVRWPAASEAADYAVGRPRLAVGLHVDLSEWRWDGGAWRTVYERVDERDAAGVAAEVDAQLAEFSRLLGRPPTHLDSHNHVHRDEPLRSILAARGEALGLPVRELAPHVRYCGDFYGQDGIGERYPEAISVDNRLRLLAALPEGVTELGCHPASEVDHDSVYGRERLQEVRALCDPRVRATIADGGITLRSFRGLPGRRR